MDLSNWTLSTGQGQGGGKKVEGRKFLGNAKKIGLVPYKEGLGQWPG